MKRISILTFMLLTGTSLYAYNTSVTKLDENAYDVFPANSVKSMGLLEKRKFDISEQDIAVLTLSFGDGEIGQDAQADVILAQKEGGKIGGTRIYYVSGTEYTKTQTIGSVTFRVVRSDTDLKNEKELEDFQERAKVEQQRNVEKSNWLEELKTAEFGKEYSAFLNDFFNQSKNAIEAKTKMHDKIIALKSGKTKTVTVDIKTGERLSQKEVDFRVAAYLKQGFDEFKKGRKDLYAKDYIALRRIDAKYLAADPGLDLKGWPDPDQYDSWNTFDDTQHFVNFIPDAPPSTDEQSKPSSVAPDRQEHESRSGVM